MSGLNSADMQAQIAQDLQQSQPTSQPAAAAGPSQPVLGMPPIPTSPNSGLAGPSISQMFRRDNAAAAPPSLFGCAPPPPLHIASLDALGSMNL